MGGYRLAFGTVPSVFQWCVFHKLVYDQNANKIQRSLDLLLQGFCLHYPIHKIVNFNAHSDTFEMQHSWSLRSAECAGYGTVIVLCHSDIVHLR